MAAKSSSDVDAVFERLSGICLGFPGAECKLSHGAPAFHVRGKTFLTFVDDHHADGRLAVWCKSTLAEQKRLVASDGARFFVPPYVGVSGWVGVRLDHPKADWTELAILVEEAWLSIAPKNIAASKPRSPAPALRLPRTDGKVAKEALGKLTRICLALPEAACEREGVHATYTVGKKTFAYFLDNHHGDEIVGACFKGAKGENAKLARSDPKRFYLPAYMASKGWIGMRLDAGKTDWKDVATRVERSYLAVAPKRIVVKQQT